MICPNCKATLNDDASFCTACGTKIERSGYQFKDSEPQPVPSDYGDGGSNVGKIIGIAVGAVVALAVIIGIVLVVRSNMKKTINLEDFVEVSYTGANGYATAYASIDENALEQEIIDKCNLEYLSEDDAVTDAQWAAVIAYEIKIYDSYSSVDADIRSSKNGSLKNGDTFTVTLDYDDTLAQEIGLKFKGEDMTFTVEGLEEVETVDVFEGVSVEFDGVSPYGTATLVNNGDYSDYNYTLDQTDNLENGDAVVVTFSSDAAEDMLYDGKTPEATTKSFTVALSEYLTSLDDLADSFINEAQDEAEDVFEDVRSDWDDAVTFESLEYETAYILTRDEYNSWYDNYYLYMVYEISVNQDGRDMTYYWYIGYYDAIVDADGNIEVDFDSYTIPETGGWFTSGTTFDYTTYSNTYGALSLTYTGYATMAELFEDLIESMDGYSYEGTEYMEDNSAADTSETAEAYIPADAYEYGGHSYVEIYTKVSWSEAEAICESMGGHLVVIDSQAENDYIVSIIDGDCWIGASCDSAYNWSTVTGGSLTYTNWDEGEPSGGDENCAVIYTDGLWNDRTDEASWHVDGFVCEWD